MMNGRRLLKVWLIAGCSLGMPCAMPVALAQTAAIPVDGQSADKPADGNQIPDIIVTARHRPESVQSTPIAMTAFGAAAIARSASVADLARSVPGLQFDIGGGISGNSFTSSIYIRGVGQNEYLSTSDPGVGLYIDGVYYARQVGSVFDLQDVDRIEILRGPQGTLFGKNAIGGAISVTTTAPGNTPSGLLQVTGGENGRADAAMMVTGPLVKDVLDAKLAVTYKSYDGYGTQANGIRTSNENALIARGQLLYRPGPDLDITLSLDGQRRRQHPATEHIVSLIPDATYPVVLWNALVGARTGTRFGPNQLTDDFYASRATGIAQSDLDAFGTSLIINYRIGNVRLKSITAFRDQVATYGHDNSASSVGLNTELVYDRQDQISQELQLNGTLLGGRLETTSGLYYFHEIPRVSDATVNFPGLFQALQGEFARLGPAAFSQIYRIPYPGVFALNYTISDRDIVNSYAAYAQGTYRLLPALSATAGVRLTRETKALVFGQIEEIGQTCLVDPTLSARDCAIPVRQSWTDVSPHAGLEFKPAPGLLLYASLSKGFKSGGFNGRAQALDLLVPYKPETLWAHEIGFKGDFFDRRARLNLSVYSNDYSNIQLDGARTTPFGSLQPFILNGGKARIRGAELEGFAIPVPNLTLNFSVAYTDGKYLALDPSVVLNGITLNSKLPRTPEWTYAIGATYRLALSPRLGSLTLHGDYNYRSHVYFDASNLPTSEQNAYAIGNVRVEWNDPTDRYAIAAAVTNLTDRQYYTNVFGGTQSANGAVIGFPGPPRQWSVQATARF